MALSQSCRKSAYYLQLNELADALRTLRRYGVPENNAAYQKLYQVRAEVMGKLGLAGVRQTLNLARFVGLSPHELALFFDIESGWFVEARTGPGAPPYYHQVSGQIAVDILKGRRLHEYAAFYARPARGVDN